MSKSVSLKNDIKDMQPKAIYHPQDTFLENSHPDSMQLTYRDSVEQKKAFIFEVSFDGRMDMYSDADTVAEYLNAHEGWFCRCAQPMKVESLADNGYILTVGKYSSFGYEIEPKMGVVLKPPVNNVYLMHTIPIPDYAVSGYNVNYQAAMKLQEVAVEANSEKGLLAKKSFTPSVMTQVTWELSLAVEVEFPQFVAKLSPKLIQKTGDRLLAQIVRQISPRLTYKVQQDFHNSHDLPVPPKSSRALNKVDKSR